MGQTNFETRLSELTNAIKTKRLSAQLNAEKESYEHLEMLLAKITYENKNTLKGMLAHFIVDSYVGDTELGKAVIVFDNSL